MQPITEADIRAAIKIKENNLISSMFPDTGPLRRELYPKHVELFALGASRKIRVMRAANRVGKALLNGMPVLTPTGWRKIETLKVGDDVIGGDGNPCYVTGVYPQGIKPVVEMFFDDGASVVASYDHLWKCRQGRERYRKGEWKVRTTAEIIKRGGGSGDPQKVAEIPLCRSYFTHRQVEMDPYVLGVLAGDGCYSGCTSQTRVSTADDEIVESISKHYPITKSRTHNFDYGLAGGAVTHLKSLELWGTKSYQKKIPHDYLWTSHHARLALLQGLMDTDGTTSKGGGAIFYSTSPSLVDAVVFLVRSLGGKAKIANKQTYYYQKSVRTAGRPSWAVRITMDVCPFRIKRKSDRWKKLTARGLERRLEQTVPCGEGECTCIAVDSPDHTFVTKDFIVTHNSLAGAFEVTCHLTGIYPHWWVGKRFRRPVNVLVAGESGKLVRDSIQMKLIGPPSAIGTGMIPHSLIIERRAKAGIADAVDTVRVKHVAGESILQYQSFDQGREAFQATERDVVWLDEEPDLPVFSECVTRTMTTQGVVILTFTPLKGVSETVQFLQEQEREGKIAIVTATWDDSPHLSEKDKEDMLAAYPPHQRDARTKGIPALGSGAIYPVPESDIVCPPFELPLYWRRGYALDVGWNRTAALWGAYDDQSDVVYLYSEHYRGQAEPSVHAEAIRARGAELPGVIDPASRGRGQKDGEQLLQNYQDLGLKLSLAKNGVESGIFEVYQRLSTGRLKVFSSLVNFLQEYRVYRRDENGKIVKENDHLMDCCVAADTMVQTSEGPKKIVDLIGRTGKVFSRDGSLLNFIGARKTIENSPMVEVVFQNGDIIKCTPDHPFLTPAGWINASDMAGKYCYDGISQRIKVISCPILSFLRQPLKSIAEYVTTFVENIFSAMGFAFIGGFGKIIAAQFRRATMFIIWTTTGRTTPSITLNLKPDQIIHRTTKKVTKGRSRKRRFVPQNSGTHLLREKNGIKNIWKMILVEGLQKKKNSPASTALLNLSHTIVDETDSVPMRVKPDRAFCQALTMKNAAVHFVAKFLLAISTLSKKHAQESAEILCLSVQKVKNEDVYCLTVPGVSAFCIGSGLVVHNTRYLMVSGINIFDFPAAYRTQFQRPRHEINYQPLGREHIAADSNSSHSYQYNPLAR